jgi:hypothetical protein
MPLPLITSSQELPVADSSLGALRLWRQRPDRPISKNWQELPHRAQRHHRAQRRHW